MSGLARRLCPLVWVFALMAACDLYRCGEWVAIVPLVLMVVATVTTPRFDRAWAVRRQAMAEEAVRGHLLQPHSDQARISADGTFVVPPLPTSEMGS